MIRDPAGLLQRITELQALCSDPRIRKAVETGHPFKVYRALAWARLTGRLAAHRRTLDLLLRSRRAFARPLTGKLFLGTLNGFGATLLGGAESEPDGTRIATHCLVVLFRVPVFPLGAYLVADGERSGLSTSWRIFARVPLGHSAWLFTRAVALAAVLAVASGAYGAWNATRHHEVTVLNGFSAPLEVTAGKVTATVPASGRITLDLPTGEVTASARAGGAEVDRGPLTVRAGSDLQIWNVAGASPLFDVQVVYTAGSAPAGPEPEPRYHCGERFVRLPRPEYAFRDPPRQISMPSSSSRTVHTAVGVVQQGGEDGAFLCGQLLLGKGRPRDALAVLEPRAALAGWDDDHAPAAAFAAALTGPDEQVRLAGLVRTARPGDVQAHRMYQGLQVTAGRQAEVLAEYRARAEAAPESALAQYLHARLLPGAEQAKVAEQLLTRFPADPLVLRLVTGVRSDALDWPGTDRAWRALREVSPQDAGSGLEAEITALAAMGRAPEAVQIVEELYPRLDPSDRGDAAVLYAQAASLAGGKVPGRLVAALEQEGKSPEPILRLRAGLPTDAGEGAGVELYRLAASDPAAALAHLPGYPAGVLGSLDAASWALLYGEALRTGSAGAKAFEALPRMLSAEREGFRRYVRGEAPELPVGLAPGIRAAAELVRSRNPALPEAERAALRRAAQQHDPLHTTVSRAIAAWAPVR